MQFEVIYKTYWDKVFRICMGYVNDNDWAKDIAQDTFVIVFQKLDTFRNESQIGTWIYRIAVNNCLRQIEKTKRLPKSDLNEKIIEPEKSNVDEKVKLLYQFISKLKEMDRIIISLELEDIKQAEIASIVGISESNVRVKIHRIKEQLAQNFKKHEYAN